VGRSYSSLMSVFIASTRLSTYYVYTSNASSAPASIAQVRRSRLRATPSIRTSSRRLCSRSIVRPRLFPTGQPHPGGRPRPSVPLLTTPPGCTPSLSLTRAGGQGIRESARLYGYEVSLVKLFDTRPTFAHYTLQLSSYVCVAAVSGLFERPANQSIVLFSPSRTPTRGSHPKLSLARLMSGQRRLGSSSGSCS
jgi:hypothetical protein